jgi:Domain of unknown function (DUF362)
VTGGQAPRTPTGSAASGITCRLQPRAPSLGEVLGRPVDWPRFVRIRRDSSLGPAPDVQELLTGPLSELSARVKPGHRVAVAVGSRGITGIATVVARTVETLRRLGAEPFIVPAMGSHGGATAEGQRATLAKLGVTEQAMGAPVLATMDVVDLGAVQPELHAHLDAHAAGADAVLIVNRLKSHTSFDGAIASGLAKMLAIGLGKKVGAELLHAAGPARIEQRIRDVAQAIVSRAPIVGGLAILEGPRHELRRVEFVEPEGIGGKAEVELLAIAKSWEARLPLDQIDVLVVDEIGKDRSGTGMDTNVIGRRLIHGSPEPTSPRITNIVALALTAASDGNATGLGLADFVPADLLASVDLVKTYANSLTAGLQGVQRAQIPIVLANARDALAAALLTSGVPQASQVRAVRMRDTLSVDDLMVSESLVSECLDRGYHVVGEGAESCLAFDESGGMSAW